MKRVLNIGLIGYGFMGRAHSNAWRQAPRFFGLPAELRLSTICGRDRQLVQQAARRLGWQNVATNWRQVVADRTIDIIDICTPNDSHCEIAIAAARAGKAILCEKPLACSVKEAEQMAAAVRKAGVANMVCHNYRRAPAIALVRKMIRSRRLGGQIFHFRARYAQDWLLDADVPLLWRLQASRAGSGALGDLLSHVIDLARYLIGEFDEICAITETFVRRPRAERSSGLGSRPMKRRKHGQHGGAVLAPSGKRVDVDDAVTVIGRFASGALASIEATRFAAGRKNALWFEINGSAGSVVFDLEQLNRVRFFSSKDGAEEQGFRDIIVTQKTHPYIANWWPPGHIIGYEHTFVNTVADFVQAIASSGSVRPEPDFADALKTQRVLEACAASATRHRWVKPR